MLPSPSSSPRPAFSNRTNVYQNSCKPVAQPKSWFSLPTPPEHGKVKRPASAADGRLKKRVKICLGNEESEDSSAPEESESDSDVEMEDVAIVRARARSRTMFQMKSHAVVTGPSGRFKQPDASTRLILQSFVSSHKSDVFKCQSTNVESCLTPPYACSYSHCAKNGKTPLLAVATEQGSVHVLDTSKRRDWDFEPPRTTWQPHTNGIFDIKWNSSDTLLATASGDQSTRISCLTTTTITHVLRGHTSTVKCVTWDPNHNDMLSTGGRDGAICMWDLRVGEGRIVDDEGKETLSPVMMIPGAHETAGSKGKGKRKGKTIPMARSVTSLVYPESEAYALISGGSFDGILRCWDIRLQSSDRKKSKSLKLKPATAVYSSPFDPTTLHGSRRPRGICSLINGTGPTAGLLFALGADSRVHSYALSSLMAQSRGYTHEHMQTNSFYVRVAASPCGRWLASGGTGPNGNVFLFDVSNAARPGSALQEGVELQGQIGEVGAVDWADGMLATCADDGTARIWRPDIETYRSCVEQPEEKRWDWSWSVEQL